jgi:CRP-like cAMP-binding protein
MSAMTERSAVTLEDVPLEWPGAPGWNDPRSPTPTWPTTGFLGQLSEDARQTVLHLGTPRRFDAGEPLLLEGTASDCAYLLVSGLYKVTGTLGSGQKEALIAIRIGGDVVGEVGLSDGQPRSAAVRSVGAGVGRRIGEDDFYAFLNRFPDANRAMARTMAGKLRSATQRRVEFTAYPAPARMARVLLELATTHGVRTAEGIEVGLDLTQPELAALVGAAEATIHRVLAQLRKDGVLRTGYRRIVVRDVRRLEGLAEP